MQQGRKKKKKKTTGKHRLFPSAPQVFLGSSAVRPHPLSLTGYGPACSVTSHRWIRGAESLGTGQLLQGALEILPCFYHWLILQYMDFVYPHLSIYQMMNSWVTSSLRPLEILLLRTFMCKKIFLMLFFFLAPRYGTWDFCSPTRDWTCAPCIEAQNLNPWTASDGPAFVLIDKPSFFLVKQLRVKFWGHIVSICLTLFWKNNSQCLKW